MFQVSLFSENGYVAFWNENPQLLKKNSANKYQKPQDTYIFYFVSIVLFLFLKTPQYPQLSSTGGNV